MSEIENTEPKEKIKIALVYSPQVGPTAPIYENEQGIIYSTQAPDRNMQNVGMGFYSIPDPTTDDCLLAIEPYCVLERDYDYTYVKNYKKIFTWTPQAFSQNHFTGKVVEINHPSCHYPPDPATMTQKWLDWDKRRDEIVFIANNKSSNHPSELYSFRLQLADTLHKHSKYKVSWYGEIPINRPYYRGKLESKNDILSQVKFSVCTENSYDGIYTHNYFTEKMPEVWFSGAIPIYMGCYNIDSFGFADHSYIDLRKYCSKRTKGWHIDHVSLLLRVENFDAMRYEHYKWHVLYNIQKENGLYHLISYPRMYDKIISTLVQK